MQPLGREAARPQPAPNRRTTNFSIDSIIGNIMGQRPVGPHTTGELQAGLQAIDLSRHQAPQEESFVDVVSVDQQQQQQQWALAGQLHTISAAQPPHALHKAAQHQTGSQADTNRKLRAKKYQCPYCWVALSNTGQFRGHIRIHTGERPFKCDQAACQKTFTRNEELTRHKRIHTGQRPYACHLCNKRFGRKDHLKKHTRTHEKNASKQHHHNHTPTTHLVNGQSAGAAGSANLQLHQQQSLKSFFISDVPLLYFNCAATDKCSS